MFRPILRPRGGILSPGRTTNFQSIFLRGSLTTDCFPFDTRLDTSYRGGRLVPGRPSWDCPLCRATTARSGLTWKNNMLFFICSSMIAAILVWKSLRIVYRWPTVTGSSGFSWMMGSLLCPERLTTAGGLSLPLEGLSSPTMSSTWISKLRFLATLDEWQ